MNLYSLNMISGLLYRMFLAIIPNTLLALVRPNTGNQTRVRAFGGRHTSKPGFEKYLPGFHSRMGLER